MLKIFGEHIIIIKYKRSSVNNMHIDLMAYFVYQQTIDTVQNNVLHVK